MARTIIELWRRATSADRPFPAYLVEEDGGWREVSWTDAATAVDELANGLLARGLKQGDAFGIMARTRLEWTLFDFALALAGGITAPVYPNTNEREARYVLDHADAIGVLVEDDEQRSKIAGFPGLISFADLDALRAEGREFAAANPGALDARAAEIDEEDLYTYIYTSGTTGPPKGCMIRHRNYYVMTSCIEQIEGLSPSGERMLLYLPLAHNFGRLMVLWGAYAGFTIAYCPDPYAVIDALPKVKPTLMPSVPRVYEKAYTAIKAGLDETAGAKRRLAEWALRIGRRVSRLRQEGRRVPPGLVVQHRIADRLVYSKIKERFGGRFRIGISGAAPLAKEIAEFFHAVDILILEGWGLTECTTAAAVNRPNRFRFGTVGPPMPGVEVKTDADGELLIRSGSVFAGYHKDPEATAEVLLADGWLRSGDIGDIDDDGFVTITDRKKDLIVTAGGKNLAPQNIENALKQAHCVSQAIVIGDRRPYVTALITLEEDVDGDAQALVQEAVDAVNRNLSRFEQIKRFAILPRDFSAEEGEVTPTLKLKRRVIEQNFAAQIEELYR